MVQDVYLADYQITVVSENGEKTLIGVNIRPYAVECLTELAQDFELIVFTASHPSYADRVIDILDPNHVLFSYKLFRNHCIQTENGLYIKDLRILNRDLSKITLVDNSILSFAFQLDNGVPIVPFYDSKEDLIFPKLKDYLLSLRDVEDYRVENVGKFGLRYLHDPNVQNLLKYYIMVGKQEVATKLNELMLAKKRAIRRTEQPQIRKKTKEAE